MRAAKYADYWRKVNIRSTAYSAVTELKNREATFPLSNFQVFSGQNGSGKSSLLRYLAADPDARLALFGDLSFLTQASTLTDVDDIKFRYTSPSWLVEENGRRLHSLKVGGQFEEYIEGSEGFDFNHELLDVVNYIINTGFTKIRVRELECAEDYVYFRHRKKAGATSHDVAVEAADDLEISSVDFLDGKALYVESSCGEDEAAPLFLSQGEQYIILLLYSIFSKKGYSFLIDEPETYLSPLAQYRLADVLARYSVDNKLQFLLASHSICFIEKANISGTLMVEGAHKGRLGISGGKKVNTFLRRLGYKVPKENIALFEDIAAKRFFANIIRSFDADWLASLELIYVNGESDIVAIISRIKNYRILAVFDADQRGKVNPKDYNSHLVVCLPGKLSPEEELIIAIKKNPTEFAKRVGGDKEAMIGYLDMIEGINFHDYFSTLANLCGADQWRLFDEAFYLWSVENSSQVEEFLHSLS